MGLWAACQLAPPLSSASGDNNIYEAMSSPVHLVSPISDTGSRNTPTVSPRPFPVKPTLTWGLPSKLALVRWGDSSCSLGTVTLSLGSTCIIFLKPEGKDLKDTAQQKEPLSLGVGAGGQALCFLLSVEHVFLLYSAGKG